MADRIRRCRDRQEMEHVVDDYVTLGYKVTSRGEDSVTLRPIYRLSGYVCSTEKSGRQRQKFLPLTSEDSLHKSKKKFGKECVSFHHSMEMQSSLADVDMLTVVSISA